MIKMLIRFFRQLDKKHYGKYRGVIVNNSDPQKLGRLKLCIPSLSDHQLTEWAAPCLACCVNSKQREFDVPKIDSQVWVEFEEGNLLRPIWVGIVWQENEKPPMDCTTDAPEECTSLSKCCDFIQCEDDSGKEFIRLIHPTDAELLIDPQGSISLTDSNGAILRLDADNNEVVVEDTNGNLMKMNSAGTKVQDSNGNVIVMDEAGISVESSKIVIKGSQVHLGDTGGEPVIKGQSFLSLFATHIHTVAPVVGGATSPPIPQGEASTLSTTVKTL